MGQLVLHNKTTQAGASPTEILPHSSRVLKPLIQAWPGLVSSEALVFGVPGHLLTMSSWGHPSGHVCVLVSSSYRTPSRLEQTLL